MEESSFGLRLRHKAHLVLDERNELALVRERVESIDNILRPEVIFTRGSKRNSARVRKVFNTLAGDFVFRYGG